MEAGACVCFFRRPTETPTSTVFVFRFLPPAQRRTSRCFPGRQKNIRAGRRRRRRKIWCQAVCWVRGGRRIQSAKEKQTNTAGNSNHQGHPIGHPKPLSYCQPLVLLNSFFVFSSSASEKWKDEIRDGSTHNSKKSEIPVECKHFLNDYLPFLQLSLRRVGAGVIMT